MTDPQTITLAAATPVAVPFGGYAGVQVLTAASDVVCLLVDGNNPSQPSTVDATTGFPLVAGQALGLAATSGNVSLCISPTLLLFSTAGATVRLWGLWG